MLWVLVCDVYPKWRNRVQVMVGVCVSVLSEAHVSRAWGNFNSVCEKRFLPFSVVAFIIFYKCGIWAFLGRPTKIPSVSGVILTRIK